MLSSVRYLLLPLAGPGDLQGLYFLERQTSNEWGYYSLARTSASTSSLIGGTRPPTSIAPWRSFATSPVCQPTRSHQRPLETACETQKF